MPTGVYVRTKEMKKHISEAHKGKYPSEETRRKLSVALEGRISPNKGHHPSEISRKKRSEICKKRLISKETGKQERPNKKINTLKTKVWKMFSMFIRLRATDKNGMVKCYTCGVKKNWKEMHAGHGISGRGNSILFDEEVVRPQCYSCNIGKGGNYDVFHFELMKEYGADFLERKLRQKNTVKKFTPEELQEKYEYYKNKVKELLEVKDE